MNAQKTGQSFEDEEGRSVISKGEQEQQIQIECRD